MRTNKSLILATLIATCISTNIFSAEDNSKAPTAAPETASEIKPDQTNKKPTAPRVATTLKQVSVTNLSQEAEQLMQAYNITLNKILSENSTPTWQNSLKPLIEIMAKLKNCLNIAFIFNTVTFNSYNDQQLSQLQIKVYQFHQQLMQNERLYQLYSTINKSNEFNELTPGQQQHIKQSLFIFTQYGINLTEHKRQHYNNLIQQLSVLGNKYATNLVQAANQAKINNSSVAMVETFTADRALRKHIYTEQQRLASAGDFNNTNIAEQILAARYDLAKLLGYDNYAQYAVAEHAPPDVTAVHAWLLDLSKKVRPIAEQELAMITDFAFKKDGIKDLQPWDVAYYAHLLKNELYGNAYNQAIEYFSVDRVITSLFNLNSILFGVQISEVPGIKAWDNKVKQYVIRDNDNKELAYFYLDLYARKEKQTSPSVLRGIERFSYSDGSQQLPIAVLNDNLKSTDDKQTLLTIEEIIDLFSNFGYMLASLLNNIDYPSLGGTNGYMQDGLLVNAKFMASLAKQKTILQDISQHYKTGAEMPDALVKQILEYNNFNAGLNMLAQIEIALLGLELNVGNNVDLNKSMQQLYSSIGTPTLLINNNLYNQIPLEFASNNASLEWIDLWSMNIAANTLEQFKAHDLFSRAQGQKYMHAFIQPLGSKSVLNLYLEFSKTKINDESLLNGLLN